MRTTWPACSSSLGADVLKVYGLTKCSTCKKAIAFLEEHGVDHEFVDYREQPIEAATLTGWSQTLGGWPKLVNRASMTWRNLPSEKKEPVADAQWLHLIEEYPALVRRPVFVRGDTVWAGFREKTTVQNLGLA